jgi:hypothetical protein
MTGVLRVGRSIAISSARSSSANTRRLTSRLTPSFASYPFGSAKVRLLVFQRNRSSSISTIVTGDRVALAAAAVHLIGI